MDATTGSQDQTLAELTGTFPRWHFWRGVGGLWYASRHRCSPPIAVYAASASALRDMVRAHPAQAGG